MPTESLSAEKLRRVCTQAHFDFETTAELPAGTNIIGQPRGTRAIEFGIGIQSEGYNIFALGPTGTGRATAIERFLHERTLDELVPDDWVYVHNFSAPHQPRALHFPAGQGAEFQKRMFRLICDLRDELPQAFAAEAYKDAVEQIRKAFEARQAELMQGLHAKAAAQGFSLINTPSGFTVAPIHDGRPITQEVWQQLPVEQRQALEKQRQALTEELETVINEIREEDSQARRKVREIENEVAKTAIRRYFQSLHQQYQDMDEVLVYLDEIHQDVLNQVEDFIATGEGVEEIDLRRYEVNVLVNNVDTQGAPVIIERHPTYHNLFGRLEFEMRNGMMTTHFTNIKCGSLHWANGGYLIMNAHDLLKNMDAWEALKRALKGKEITVQPFATMQTGQVLAKSLDPQPIPLEVKIILMGSPAVYYALFEHDEDFRVLFKVHSDFASTMPRDHEHEEEYARFIATRCHEEGLLHFDRSAVAKVVEYASREAGHQNKMSTRFGAMADLIRESSYWAGQNGRDTVTAADVRQTLEERIFRANQIEELLEEQILEGTLLIATEGHVVGQVNGLSVLDTGDYAFGQPGRITARTYMGEDGVVHIERETNMAGPLHNKGVLTLVGYLGGVYAQKQPLSLTASLTFEQNYGGVDGDSASSTELYALLSSLSGIPIKQGIAVTGSVNQRGEVQPIGGVNEKIEGFFRVCEARGLTGEQGVMIPASNAKNLMLHEDVVMAVAEGKFHIWPVKTIDEGIELLTGVPAGERNEDGTYPEGTVHYVVQNRLLELAEELKAFGEED
ncbi:MAG: Lon protease family protein [Anaerolineae bacterium]